MNQVSDHHLDKDTVSIPHVIFRPKKYEYRRTHSRLNGRLICSHVYLHVFKSPTDLLFSSVSSESAAMLVYRRLITTTYERQRICSVTSPHRRERPAGSRSLLVRTRSAPVWTCSARIRPSRSLLCETRRILLVCAFFFFLHRVLRYVMRRHIFQDLSQTGKKA